MEPRVNYTIVGVFVVVLGAALLSAVLWLGQEHHDTVYDPYYAFMGESVSGLNVNAPVKYRGVEVGRVKALLLDPQNPEQVRLTLEIARGTPIKEDTLATLSMQGLTGLAFVDLTGGSREAPLLKPRAGEPYPVIKSKPSLLVRMDQAVSTLLTNLNQIAMNLNDLVDEESRTSFSEFLANLASLSEALAARESQLDHLLASAGRVIGNTEKVSAQLPTLIARISDSIESLQHMTQDIAQTSRNVSTIVTGNQQNIERFTSQTLSEVALLVGELRQLTVTFQRLAQQLEQEPSALIFGRRPLPPGPGE
jgi:phospholipid/cholesterol/gamma-HCH transport system substrate-binding protein